MTIQTVLGTTATLLTILKNILPLVKRKSNQLSVRLDPQLLAEVAECAEITGLDTAVFMREAFKAFVAEVREKGEIRLPLAVVPKKGTVSSTDLISGRPARLEGDKFHPSTSDTPTTYRIPKKPKPPKP